ncbi:CopG-like domain-containing protein DNA-binding protein [Actinobacteria bacterium OK006]|nr:CopG-like domain-containing protein DNA-binding protein [Actinobacteria bacterium OK006]
MRDARQISAREVSQGVQRHVLDQTTWFGSTVMAQCGAAPLVFERLTARVHPADHGRSERRIAATVTPPWKTQARLSYLAATARRFLSLVIVRSISLLRLWQSAPEGPSPSLGRCFRGVRPSPSLAAASCALRQRVGGRDGRWNPTLATDQSMRPAASASALTVRRILSRWVAVRLVGRVVPGKRPPHRLCHRRLGPRREGASFGFGFVVAIPVLYALLYGRNMSKSVTIRVPEELHAQLQERAEAEGTTVTALITEAAHNAVRDPRLDSAADVFRAFVADNAAAFDAAFPDDAPARLDVSGRTAA